MKYKQKKLFIISYFIIFIIILLIITNIKIKKKILKLYFTDFLTDFNSNKELIFMIRNKYKLIITNKNPNYIIYGRYGLNYKNYKNAVKIFISQDKVIPDFNKCDYAIGYHNIQFEDRYLKSNLFFLTKKMIKILKNLKKKILVNDIKKIFFCTLIGNYQNNPFKNYIFEQLNNYKKINLEIKYIFDNSEYYINHQNYKKIKYLSQFKFILIYDDNYDEEYTLKIIYEAFQARTIPIYFGNSKIINILNKDAFIYFYNDDKNYFEKLEKILLLDNNYELYLKIINQKYLIDDNYINNEIKNIKKFFNNIFDQKFSNAKRQYKTMFHQCKYNII